MAETEARRIGVSFDVKPHAYDPATQPEYFEGVLSRRMMAFLIDVVIICLPVLFASLFILVFGLLTLGLGWMLFWLLSPGGSSGRSSITAGRSAGRSRRPSACG